MTTDVPPKKAVPTRLRPGSEVEIDFLDLLSNGQGVGRVFGVVVFCFGPLPGERALVRIETMKKTYVVARAVKLLTISPNRIKPFCPAFGACGGCQVQHLEYRAQLEWKRGLVRNALERIGGLGTIDVRPTVGMFFPRNYRNKMSLVVDNRFAPPALGFYRQRSHEVVPIGECGIVAPPLSEYITRLDEARRSPATARAFRNARHIVARTARASNQTVVTFTTPTPSDDVQAASGPLSRLLPGVTGIANSFDLPSTNSVIGKRIRATAGGIDIEETIDDVRYVVSPASFFQVNVEIVGRIFSFMRSGLTQPRKMVDLYCGAGTFSLFFAKRGCTVLGLEENPQAIVEAGYNAQLNDVSSLVSFRVGRVDELLAQEEIRTQLSESEIVFLDPPRKGSDEPTLRAISELKVPNIWYLSCDPATLARDLRFLASNGYAIGVVQPFDMFPQTGHVETLVTLYHRGDAMAKEIANAFADVPVPQWPHNEFPQERPEYPEFVFPDD